MSIIMMIYLSGIIFNLGMITILTLFIGSEMYGYGFKEFLGSLLFYGILIITSWLAIPVYLLFIAIDDKLQERALAKEYPQ